MKVVDITRKFSYNGIPLPDPNNTLDPNQVREFYSMQYPELATAADSSLKCNGWIMQL